MATSPTSIPSRVSQPVHPGAILQRHYLDPLGWSIARAARLLGLSRQACAQVLHGHRSITPGLVARLAQVFRTTPALWEHLQQAHDLHRSGETVRQGAKEEA